MPLPIGLVIAPLYGAVIGWRNRRFDAGLGVSRLAIPVVSVGNLSVGGTGKTPMVACLVEAIIAAEHRPCIAMRGYRPGRVGGSDEAAWYRARFPAVPIVVQPDRLAGLRALLASEAGRAVDCVVLDDGFQHRKLARDLDIVLLDVSQDPLRERLLPAGWFRESMSSLRRAGAVVLTHAESSPVGQTEAVLAEVRRAAPNAMVAIARHEWAGLECRWTQGERPSQGRPADSLRGKRVLAVCAIGNPGPFLAQAAAVGELSSSIVLRDHHAYDRVTVDTIIRRARRCDAEAILTTEKDWAKLAPLPIDWPCPVLTASLRLTFDRGWNELREAVLRALERRQPAPPR